MAPFGLNCHNTSSYQSDIVSIALSCIIFEIFDVEEYYDFEILIGVAQSANLCAVCASLKSIDLAYLCAADASIFIQFYTVSSGKSYRA